MEFLLAWSDIWKQFAPFIMTFIVVSAVGFLGKVALFSKANQPYWAAFVPIYDVIITMRVVGRPDAHAFRIFIPIYNIYFAFLVFTELAQSFGKTKWMDYALACTFNIFYVLHLAFSYSIDYHGPVYQSTANSANVVA
jgi:signal peptidase I